MLKSQYLWQQMDEDDGDFHCSNDISRYSSCPKFLEDITLAEFVSFYQRMSTPASSCLQSSVDQNFLQETLQLNNEDEDDDDNSQVINSETQSKKTTTYKRRKQGHVLRSVHFNPETDSEKYHRELIM